MTTLGSCREVKGGWQAQGAVTNDTSRDLDYSVLVFFTDAQARTVDFARTKVVAPAATSRKWTATKKFAAPAAAKCVVRAVQPAS
ncbi:hypothetical protein [Pedococcus sp. P5_B7]